MVMCPSPCLGPMLASLLLHGCTISSEIIGDAGLDPGRPDARDALDAADAAHDDVPDVGDDAPASTAESWILTLGGEGTVEAEGVSIVEAADGGFVVLGTTRLPDGEFEGDAWLIKLDAHGNVQWQERIGGVGADAAALDDGSIVIVGSIDLAPWVARVEADGRLLWSRILEGAGEHGLVSVAPDREGGVVVCGQVHSGEHDGAVTWMARLDGEGHLLWQRIVADTGMVVQPERIVVDDALGILIAGHVSRRDGGGGDLYSARFDLDGSLVWQKRLDAGGTDTFQVLSTDGAGLIYLAGLEDRPFTLTMDADGSIVDGDPFSVVDQFYLHDGTFTDDGRFVLAGGRPYFPSDTHSNHLVAVLDTDFEVQRMVQFGLLEWNSVFSLIGDSTGSYVMAGGTGQFDDERGFVDARVSVARLSRLLSVTGACSVLESADVHSMHGVGMRQVVPRVEVLTSGYSLVDGTAEVVETHVVPRFVCPE